MPDVDNGHSNGARRPGDRILAELNRLGATEVEPVEVVVPVPPEVLSPAPLNFEDLVREYRGRPPTAKETQRILACNRLLKTTDFDPVTIFLTIFSDELDRLDASEVAERLTIEALARIEKKLATESRSSHLERIETAVVEQGRKLDVQGRQLKAIEVGVKIPDIKPLAVHVGAAVALLSMFAVGFFASRLPLPAAVGIIVGTTCLAYFWLAPLIAPSLADALRRLRR